MLRIKQTINQFFSPAFAHVRKNWHPFVLGPLLADDSSPGPVCFATNASSANRLP
jgi:hypothetical protein